MVRSLVVAGGGRLAITKKLVLWSVLILQLGFIGCIWLMQLNYGQEQLMEQDNSRVHFLKAKGAERKQGRKSQCNRHTHENVNRYEMDFYEMKVEQVNQSNPDPGYVDLEPALWCYREGTLNESHLMNEVDYLMGPQQCKCNTGWHGRDCGQPEIIWRALMTYSWRASKQEGRAAPLQLREASGGAVHRLYYLMDLGEWDYLSLELMELQLRALIEVVDYFLIYYVSNSSSQDQERSVSKWLRGSNASYVLYPCSRAANCSSSLAYSYFRRQLWLRCGVQMQAKDLLLYGNRDSVYAPYALKYLKYYAKDVLPLSFRLKFNVYGFFWQHPLRTLISGVISSLAHLHLNDLSPQMEPSLYTLGDLNHFGGWFCQLCLPPEQIVLLLQSSYHKLPVRLPNDTRQAQIDASYIQQLIAQGLYLDGVTHLINLHQQSEKYYAPPLALSHGSQFGQLLVNLYDVEDEEED